VGEAVGEVLPLAVGVSLSPIPIVAVVLMLATPHGRSNGLGFVLGWIGGLTAAGTIVLGDITVNRLGFGAMRLCGPGVWGPPTNPENALAVLRRAVALGINFIDTANAYGPHVNEEQIAAALAAQLGVACENARRYDEVQRNLRRLEQEMAERHQVEYALRANEERLARIVETIADGILFFDADGKITFANSTAEHITGLRRTQLLERDYRTWAWRFADAQGEALMADKSFFARVCQSQASIFAAQRRIQRPDGSHVVVSCNAAPILDAEGRLTGVLGSFTDITDRLQGEEERREVGHSTKRADQRRDEILYERLNNGTEGYANAHRDSQVRFPQPARPDQD